MELLHRRAAGGIPDVDEPARKSILAVWRSSSLGVSVAFAVLLLARPALAHDPGLSSVVLRIESTAIEAAIRVSQADLQGPLGASALRLEVDGRELTPAAVRSLSVGAGQRGVRLRYKTYRPSRLSVTSNLLAALPFGHRQYARIETAAGELVADAVLTAERPTVEIAPQLGGASASSAYSFFQLGIRHILTGYDHLLFLFALLLGGPGWRGVLRIVTPFTAAHSLTLVVATVGSVEVPSWVVEPLIAASIVYAGLLNALVPGVRRERLAVTFGCGWIHGLGFAGALADLSVAPGTATVALPLVAFTAGVEVGQLAVATAVVPALQVLRRHPVAPRRAIPACSSLVAAIGLFWLIERTLLA